MVKNKIITLWVCVCLGLGLCLSEAVLLCYLIQSCSSQIITGVSAKLWLCSVLAFNICYGPCFHNQDTWNSVGALQAKNYPECLGTISLEMCNID